MSASSQSQHQRQRQRAGRKGYYSCDFCRARKLRCDRPLPCTNCRSRAKTCHFENEPTTPVSSGDRDLSTPVSTTAVATPTDALNNALEQPLHAPIPSPSSSRQPQTVTMTPKNLIPSLPSFHGELLAEVQTLRRLTQQLEKRVIENATSLHRCGNNTVPSPASSATFEGTFTPYSDLVQVGSFVAHLQHVSMGRSSLDSFCADDLVLKVARIRTIPQAPTYTSQLGKPTPCIWLPRHAEAKVLTNCFIEDISFIQHVVHHPSLPAIIDDVYRQIDSHEPVKPGHLILLLSIIASATHVWAPPENADCDSSLFLSSAQANAQTPLWIKEAYAVLNATHDNFEPTLETIQGLIILSCVVASLEGVSMRLRSLLSTALVFCRELNLHRIDHGSKAITGNTVQIEMGRRVWWYLVATDWLMAARYGGPCEGVYQTNPIHMTVNKPQNINDIDLAEEKSHFEMSATRPTDMSYFLQRLRLAEISRSIVDHNLISTSSPSQPSYYAHVMAMDVELDQFINRIPPFFRLDSYELSPESNKGNSVFIQAYMLNSQIHTQRCKLHLPYLISTPNSNPSHAASRHTCLKSARQIIRAESQLLRSQHSFVRIRLRLAAILYSVFMASIVLSMDACLNRATSPQRDILHGDVAEAFAILEGTRSHSLAAAKLLESLMHVVARYRIQQHQQPISQAMSVMEENCTSNSAYIYTIGTGRTYAHYGHDPSTSVTSLTPAARSSSEGASIDPALATGSFLMEGLDTTLCPDPAEWNELFSDLASTSFF